MAGQRMTGAEHAGEDAPAPDERLPPRQARHARRRSTKRPPHVQRLSKAPEVKPEDASEGSVSGAIWGFRC
jgi:hypothetical protein